MNYRLNAVALLIFSVSAAQVNFTNPDEGNILSFQTKPIDLSDVKTEGSPYLNDEFQTGKVFFRDEEKLKGNLRYNAYSSEIELQKSDTEFSSILKRNYISAQIGDKTYKIFPFIDEGNGAVRTGYFTPLNEGKIKLLYKPEVKIRRGRAPSTSYGRTIAPRFIDISSYYLVQGDEPAEKIYLKKKYLYNVLDKKRLKTILDENDLNIRKEEDVLRLLEIYNKGL